MYTTKYLINMRGRSVGGQALVGAGRAPFARQGPAAAWRSYSYGKY